MSAVTDSPNVRAAQPQLCQQAQELTTGLALAHRSAILGPALDDYVGAVLSKKGDINGPGSATDREFLQTEIRALKANLAEYERGSNDVANQRKELQGTLVKQQEDQKDNFQYLNGELAKKTDEIVALEERVLRLEEENDEQIRQQEGRLLGQKDAADQDIARLHKEIAGYKEQLEKVRCAAARLSQPCPG